MNPPRVLVIDDEPSLLRATERVLTTFGFSVSTAASAALAVECVKNQSFDVALSDVCMPGMDGIQLLRAIREYDLDLPVILVTGRPDIDSAARAVEHGAFRYLLKPVTNDHLVQTIRQALKFHQLSRAKRELVGLMGINGMQAGDRAGLEQVFERALAALTIAYQPIVSAADGSVVAYEAFMRTNDFGLPSPIAMLEAAERLNRMADLGRVVRERTVEPLEDLPPAVLLFVNLHASDLADPDLLLEGSPMVHYAERVVLEVTERSALERVTGARERVAALRRVGYRIALDDLGTGYAGLSTFAQLEPEFVKLDMTLVRDIHTSHTKRRLVGSVAKLCQELQISVVAEGVEVAGEHAALTQLGVDLLQGYLYARPGAPVAPVAWEFQA